MTVNIIITIVLFLVPFFVCYLVKFFPSGKCFATASDDGTCRMFDLGSGRQISVYATNCSIGSCRGSCIMLYNVL